MAVPAQRRLGALILASGLALAVAPPVLAASPARSGPAHERYVALGDSFTAGPLIPWPAGRPAGCRRSDHNYPALLAKRLRFAEVADVSCSGATTRNMTEPQRVGPTPNPPQLAAVTTGTTLVTVGIGGNDIGFEAVTVDCALIGITDLSGAPCGRLLGDQLDRRIAAVGPQIAAVLRAVHVRAPHARVLVIGYLRLLPAGRHCWPMVPYAAGDVAFLDRTERSLNEMLRREAAAGGAEFVDTYRDGTGHDMCAAPRAKWVEGVVLTHPAAPIHPNAAGMRAVAARIVALLTASADRGTG